MTKSRRRQRIKHNAVRAADQPTAAVTQLMQVSDEASAPSHRNPEAHVNCAMSEDTYFRERTTLIEMEQKSADQHDKAVLNLSTGALGLSLTFIDKIAPDPAASTLWLVGAAWISFIVCIFVMLLSFLTSQSACRRQRDLLDGEYSNGYPPDDVNKWSTGTHYLNFVAYACFVFGVIFLSCFSWANLKLEKQVSNYEQSGHKQDADSPSGIEIERGIVPPKRLVESSTGGGSGKSTNGGKKGDRK